MNGSDKESPRRWQGYISQLCRTGRRKGGKGEREERKGEKQGGREDRQKEKANSKGTLSYRCL